ncbi:hypothetical protein A2V56_01985 [Candidatus Woesebacteria bacterium RBG_19FT_COMBO_42_9]|uniref:HTH merR-type domain-containing protein n=1 Tax=Candidatus Woesebacteria bacterium RBG_16_42_24 TaxID=1802485 RepID=A0A1F7XKY2_9BACT|nr:MAG: hypothetical protein A2V97_02570 [Candidatus Woesebacteria bacterium RBG_16_42_24]OGM17082.1 MAG: hypothetical protein A2V56_01985 [Candidatus Woesebacteria bacterium RBG_19FT_COMBO_42_9]OGM67890.1 MAG: hypothetical protein A2985_02245 [Candidatus Woesebacteria bacterium RIFCSPLOWO2_01_FULL_43_11]
MQDTSESLIMHLSIGKASKYLGVSIDTLRRWEKKEKISSHRSPGGHRYFLKEDLDQVFRPKKKEKPNLVTEAPIQDRQEYTPPSLPEAPQPPIEAEINIPVNEPLSWQGSEPSETPQEEPLVLNESVSVEVPTAPSYQPPYVEEIPSTPAPTAEAQSSNSEETLLSIKENIIGKLPQKRTVTKIYFIFLGLFLLVDAFLFFYWVGLKGNSFLSPLP